MAGQASVTRVSNFSYFHCLLPLLMIEKLPQMNSENTILKGVLIIYLHQAIFKPLNHELDPFFPVQSYINFASTTGAWRTNVQFFIFNIYYVLP